MFTDDEIAILTAIYGPSADGYIEGAPKIARATLDAFATLPDGFIRVTDRQPESEAPVLAIRRSGYVCSSYELITARFQPDYRPKSPWRDLSGSSVRDSGEPILAWRWENATLRPST